MPDLKKELAVLKAENKKLKALLKNAVHLLHQSKQLLQHPGKGAAAEAGRAGKKLKRAVKKKVKTAVS